MEEKVVCTKCGVEKLVSEFHKRCDSRKGIASHCKECRNVKAAKDYQREPGKYNTRCKNWRGTFSGHATYLHRDKKKWCVENNIEYNLSRSWYLQREHRGCKLTGIPFRRGALNPYSASVDRIDSTKGYTRQNCRMILFGLNALKGTGTDQDMILIVKAFLNQQG